jgi:hypothetical protein
MRFEIHGYAFRPGTVILDGKVYDANNDLYLDLLQRQCERSTECTYAGHFNYPERCDGQLFELVGTAHHREDPQTQIVDDSDTELAPMQGRAMRIQQAQWQR